MGTLTQADNTKHFWRRVQVTAKHILLNFLKWLLVVGVAAPNHR